MASVYMAGFAGGRPAVYGSRIPRECKARRPCDPGFCLFLQSAGDGLDVLEGYDFVDPGVSDLDSQHGGHCFDGASFRCSSRVRERYEISSHD